MFKITAAAPDLRITENYITEVIQYLGKYMPQFLLLSDSIVQYLEKRSPSLMVPTVDGIQVVYLSTGSNEMGPYVAITFCGAKITITKTDTGTIKDQDILTSIITTLHATLRERVSNAVVWEPIMLPLKCDGPAQMKIIKGRNSDNPVGLVDGKERYAVVPFGTFEGMISTLAESPDYNPDVENGLNLIKEFKDSVDLESNEENKNAQSS